MGQEIGPHYLFVYSNNQYWNMPLRFLVSNLRKSARIEIFRSKVIHRVVDNPVESYPQFIHRLWINLWKDETFKCNTASSSREILDVTQGSGTGNG